VTQPPFYNGPHSQNPPPYERQFPAPARRRRRWPWVIAGVVVLLFLVSALSNRSDPAPATPQTSAGSPIVPATTTTRVPTPVTTTAAAPVVAVGPKTSFGEGTWVVGEEIEPGTYRTTGAAGGFIDYCQVTTYSDEAASSDKLLDLRNGNADEPIRIKISGKVKSVTMSGCEDFVKVA
jgi:hypothetical protein